MGPCGCVCVREGVGAGGGLAGEMGRDADDEGIVLVLLVEDGQLRGEIGWRRSAVDRIIACGRGRRRRAVGGHLGGVRLLFLDAFGPDIDLRGLHGGRGGGGGMGGLLLLLGGSRGGGRARLFGTLGVGLVWVARGRDHSYKRLSPSHSASPSSTVLILPNHTFEICPDPLPTPHRPIRHQPTRTHILIAP